MLPTKMSHSLRAVPPGAAAAGAEDAPAAEAAPPAEADKADRSLRFDRILCDVPCSGDGTLRKAPDLWRRWTDGLAMGIHRMQRSLLLRGLQMLHNLPLELPWLWQETRAPLLPTVHFRPRPPRPQNLAVLLLLLLTGLQA
jgi:hypothetical protein